VTPVLEFVKFTYWALPPLPYLPGINVSPGPACDCWLDAKAAPIFPFTHLPLQYWTGVSSGYPHPRLRAAHCCNAIRLSFSGRSTCCVLILSTTRHITKDAKENPSTNRLSRPDVVSGAVAFLPTLDFRTAFLVLTLAGPLRSFPLHYFSSRSNRFLLPLEE